MKKILFIIGSLRKQSFNGLIPRSTHLIPLNREGSFST